MFVGTVRKLRFIIVDCRCDEEAGFHFADVEGIAIRFADVTRSCDLFCFYFADAVRKLRFMGG